MARPLQFASTRLGRATLPLLLIFANVLVPGQDGSIYRIAAGTKLRLKMDVELNSRVASVNDTFTASVAKPVITHDVIVVPIGTVVEGRVAGVDRAGSPGSNGRLELAFGTIHLRPDAIRTIDAIVIDRPPHSQRSPNIVSIVAGTIVGAIVGALAGSGRGALIGAGAGAGVGTGVTLSRSGKDAVIRGGQEFEIVLKKDLVLPVIDY